MSHALALPTDLDVPRFREWAAAQDGRWQLIDGEPEAMSPGSPTHARLHAEIVRLLGNHLVQTRPDCAVHVEPGVVPQQRPGQNYRIPDVAVSCRPNDREAWDLQHPIVIVEVLSPSNPAQTWLNVWAYTSIASVQEIVVVQSGTVQAALLRREAEGGWPAMAVPLTGDDALMLRSLAFEVPVRALYRTTHLR